MPSNQRDQPWYLGLRKWSLAVLVLASLVWAASVRVIDGNQFLGGVGSLVAAFFTVNYVSRKTLPAAEGKQ